LGNIQTKIETYNVIA